jgi:catechol 2,3-dioxygenase-like lactoylglutathione lyase family enzyme
LAEKEVAMSSPDTSPTALPEAPAWRGINHLALVTPDMDATVRFYAGVLGMRLVCTTMAGPMRHYFFEMEAQNTIAFFEIAGMETFAKPAGGPPDRAIQLDHISFNVPDEHALEMLRKRILAAGSEVTGVVDHGFIRSIYFTDPNGIALEASYWVTDATGRPSDYGDPRLFGDPDPVPAVQELRAGELASVPHTRLV